MELIINTRPPRSDAIKIKRIILLLVNSLALKQRIPITEDISKRTPANILFIALNLYATSKHTSSPRVKSILSSCCNLFDNSVSIL